jgi:hypothetical protein
MKSKIFLLAVACVFASGCSRHSGLFSSETRPRARLQYPDPLNHVIAKGDTLMAISRRYTGSASNWKRIAAVNPGIDAQHLHPGEILIIPARLAKTELLSSSQGLQESDFGMDTKADAVETPAKKSTTRSARKTNEKKSRHQPAAESNQTSAKKSRPATAPTTQRMATRRSEDAVAAEKPAQAKREVLIFDPASEDALARAARNAEKGDIPAKTASRQNEVTAKTIAEPPAAATLPRQSPSSLPSSPALPSSLDRNVAIQTRKPAQVSTNTQPQKRERAMLHASASKPVNSVEQPAVLKKPARKSAVAQDSRSTFYSCVADKCAVRSFSDSSR